MLKKERCCRHQMLIGRIATSLSCTDWAECPHSAQSVVNKTKAPITINISPLRGFPFPASLRSLNISSTKSPIPPGPKSKLLPLILPLNRFDFSHTFAVALFRQFCREPGTYDLPHLIS